MNKSVKRANLFVLVHLKRFLDRVGIGRIPGMKKTYRFLKRKFIPRGLIQVDFHGSKLFVDIRDEVVAPSLLANAPESYELQVFKGLIRPGMVVVDIGAHIGIYTIAAARLAGAEGKVYAFEPEDDNYRILVSNIEANGLSNVVPIQMAVTNKKSVHRLYISKYNLAGHSLNEENVQDPAGYREVKTTSLDDFYADELQGRKVDVLKSDTEGAEGLIMDGGRRFITGNEFSALMECWPSGLGRLGYSVEDLLKLFEEYGMTYEVLDRETRQTRKMGPQEIIEMCLQKESVDYPFSFLLKRSGNQVF